MRKRTVLLVLVLLALAACAAEGRRSRRLKASSKNRRTDFDFFFLVRQWPATFCNDHFCTHRPPKQYEFTLHGMWPQRRDGTWPEFCDPSSHLDVDQLDDLMDDMEHDWPSWSSADETFWDHEWNRHGTCAAPVTGGQHRYFQAVLALHHKLNLQDALSAAGIRPSNSKRYPVQDIKDAIEAKYGVMPHVTCDGKGELSEIWMCINKKLRVIDCVEDPRPPHRKAASPSAAAVGKTAEQAEGEDLASAPAPPNYNCNMVTIPKLLKHWGKVPGLDAVAPAAVQPEDSSTHSHHHHKHHKHHDHQQDDDDDAVDAEYILEAGAELAGEVTAELAAAVQPLLESAASVVQELAAQGAAAADSAAAGLSSVAASLAAVEQAAAAVATGVTEAVVETAADAGSADLVAEAAQQLPVVASNVGSAVVGREAAGQAPIAEAQNAAELQQEQLKNVAAAAPAVDVVAPAVANIVADKMQEHAVAAPNKHLPMLAGVVVAVVAAAVVAAAVALKAAPCRADGKAATYIPPRIADPEPSLPCEASPLLAGTNTV